MKTIVDVAKEVKETNFLVELLQEFVGRGLGSLPGRETTIALVDLLLKHHPDWKKDPPRDFEIARLLRTSPRKVRNIRDEISYRDTGRDDKWCRDRLIETLSKAEQLKEGKTVSFQIDDGLVRDYAQKLVRENYGVFEHGLNASIIKISGEAFATLVVAIMPEDKRDELFDKTAKVMQIENRNSEDTKNVIRIFFEAFAKKFGEESGKQSSQLAFTLLTGGLSEIGKGVELVKKMFDK